MQHVEHVQNELRREIREKMRHRFDIVEIPRNITINDFCLAAVINLVSTLTSQHALFPLMFQVPADLLLFSL